MLCNDEIVKIVFDKDFKLKILNNLLVVFLEGKNLSSYNRLKKMTAEYLTIKFAVVEIMAVFQETAPFRPHLISLVIVR